MDNSNINQREDSMINFMDEVDKHNKSQQAANNYANSVDVKRRILNKKKDDAKGICLDLIFSKIYKDALPMDDEYKVAHGNDLDAEFHDFISDKAPDGLEYYVKESIKKGNKAAKSIMEEVDKLVKENFFEASMALEDSNSEDVEFDPDSEENQEKIKDITDSIGGEDISEIIKKNVKQTAIDDIEKTKKHDEELKGIVDDLKNDPKITTEASLDRALRLRGVGVPKFYQPSLFEGIMINKTNLIKNSGEKLSNDIINKKAFTESVKELTKINVLHALNFEPISTIESKKLAKKYAQMKVPSSKVSLYSESYDDLYIEGANLEIRKVFKENNKAINDNLKEIQKLIKKDKDYKTAKVKIDETSKLLKKVKEDVLKIDSTVGSTILAWLFTGDIMFIGRELIYLLSPLAGLVIQVDTVIKRIKVLIEDEDISSKTATDKLNLYKNGILVRLNEYISALKVLKSRLAYFEEYDKDE